MTRTVLCAATQLLPAAARISQGVAPLRIDPSKVGKAPPEPVVPPVALEPPLPPLLLPPDPPVESEPPNEEHETTPMPRDTATDTAKMARLFFIPMYLRL
jgi:hypothetical protein